MRYWAKYYYSALSISSVSNLILYQLFPDAVSPLTLSTIMSEMGRRQEETMYFKSDLYNGKFTTSYVITHNHIALNVHKVS